jgi:hypothetical protein
MCCDYFPALIVAVRIAIWNRNRIIVTIAVGVWLANLSFLIHSKSVLLMFGPDSDSLINVMLLQM